MALLGSPAVPSHRLREIAFCAKATDVHVSGIVLGQYVALGTKGLEEAQCLLVVLTFKCRDGVFK